MITFDRFTFAGPPRTARHWFVKSTLSYGFARTGGLEEIVSEPIQQIEGRVSVTLVRHPLTWLDSMYRKPPTYRYFQNTPLNILIHHISLRHPEGFFDSPSRQGFYKLVCDMTEQPGTIKRLFDYYQADIALRVEDLPWSAHLFFENVVGTELKIPAAFAYNRTCSDPPVPVPRNHQEDIKRIDPCGTLRKFICKSEKEFCEKYNYY